MAFNDSSINYLAGLSPAISYQLKVKTDINEPWRVVNLVESGFNLERSVYTVSSSLTFLTATRDTGFTEGSSVELWAKLGLNAVQSCIFAGFVIEQLRDSSLVTNLALDYTELLRRRCAELCRCQRSVAPVLEAALILVPSAGEGLWGLNPATHPTGFEPTGRRRSWAIAPVVITDAGQVLSPEAYYTDFSSGLIRIYAPVTQPVLEYCRPLIAGTNDVADILRELLTYPASAGGPGISADKLLLAATGVDIPQAVWYQQSGAVLEAWTQLKRELPDDWFFSYRADIDKLVMQPLIPSDNYRFKLPHIIKAQIRSSIDNFATDVVIAGILDRPPNYACTATVIDCQENIGDTIRWRGSTREVNPPESNPKLLWVDADHNTGFGHSSDSYVAGNWYNLVKIDLGEIKAIGELRLTAGNSHNPNALKQDDRNLLPAYQLWGSLDDVDYYPLTTQQPIECLPIETVTLSKVLMPRLRFIQVRCRAYCDTNSARPAVTLNELSVYPPASFAALARAQSSEPNQPDYFTEPLNKYRLYGRSVVVKPTDTRYGQVAAQELAHRVLAKCINNQPQILITTITNPLLELGDTVWLDEPGINYHGRILIERLSLTPELCKIVARPIA